MPDPPPEPLVVREQLEHRAVGRGDVGRVAGERHPPERSLPLAEQRADVGRDEARVVERALEATEPTPRRAGCCRSRRPPPRGREATIAAQCVAIARAAPAHVLRGIVAPQRGGLLAVESPGGT